MSPLGSGSTFQSSSEIKEFYYDDELCESLDTSLDRHLDLQTPALDIPSSSLSQDSRINIDLRAAPIHNQLHTPKAERSGSEEEHSGRREEAMTPGWYFSCCFFPSWSRFRFSKQLNCCVGSRCAV
jgi:hypothetical protein